MKLINRDTINSFKFIKIETLYFLILVFSMLWLKKINYLFYNTIDSPDFEKYFVYFEHFFTNVLTNKEHGFLYYYMQAINFEVFYSQYENFNFYLHKSIQEVNFYIYLFGVIGYFLLFKLLKFKNSSIFLGLIFLNFFPPSISMRLVFKPEILTFSLFPWIIYLLEQFKSKKEFQYIWLSIPFLIGAITTKGNALVLVSIYLLLIYHKILYSLFKNKKIMILTTFLIFFTCINLENIKDNGKNILDIQSGSSIEEQYDFKAPLNIIYKIDFFKLFSSPIKHNHASSFIGITLLETTGDYFDLYWDNDASIFFKNRKNLVLFEQSYTIKAPKIHFQNQKIIIYQQNLTDVYLNESIGLVISIFLFYLLFKSLSFDINLRKFYYSIFLGMLLLLIHSMLGIPKNNFDPLVGDTFKPLYYSFFFLFSFTLLITNLIDKREMKPITIFIYCFIIIYLLGFPKIYNYEIQSKLAPKIESSVTCEIEKNIFLKESPETLVDCSFKDLGEKQKNDLKLTSPKPFNLLLLLLILLNSFLITFKFDTSLDSSYLLKLKSIKNKK